MILQLFATPTKALTILVAQATSRLILALAQTILILLMAVRKVTTESDTLISTWPYLLAARTFKWQ